MEEALKIEKMVKEQEEAKAKEREETKVVEEVEVVEETNKDKIGEVIKTVAPPKETPKKVEPVSKPKEEPKKEKKSENFEVDENGVRTYGYPKYDPNNPMQIAYDHPSTAARPPESYKGYGEEMIITNGSDLGIPGVEMGQGDKF